jgi:uncharacterized membrane protein
MSQAALVIDKGRSDRRMDEWIGLLLRAGVILASFTVLAGGLFYLIRRPAITINYHVFQGEPRGLRTIPGILGNAKAMSGRGLIQLGLLLLIATPITRVAFSVLAFFYQRDWKYVFFTMVVLALLLCSLIRGG